MQGTVWDGTTNQWPGRWRSWAWHLHLFCRERKSSQDVLPVLVSQQRLNMTNCLYTNPFAASTGVPESTDISVSCASEPKRNKITNVLLSNEPSGSVPIRRGQEEGWVGISCQHIIRRKHTVLGKECALSASDISVGSSKQETLQNWLESESLRIFIHDAPISHANHANQQICRYRKRAIQTRNN